MKILCNKDTLNGAVSAALRAVSSRSSLAVLEGIYICAEESGRVTIIGNDLEIAVEAVIEADVREPGEIVLDAKLFARVLATSASADISIETLERNVLIRCGSAKIEMACIPPDDFPDLPQVDDDYSVSLPCGVLKNMIESTSFAAAKTDNDPTRMGSLLEIKPHGISMVALDGFRIAKRSASLEGEFVEKSMIIPEKSLVELARLMDDEDESVKITASNSHVVFEIDGCRLITRLIDGTYTNYERIIPTSYDIEIECSTHQIADSVKRASLIIINDAIKGPIKFKITDGNINISCSTAAGHVDDNIAVDTAPDTSLIIGFYNRYLTEVFNVLDDDSVMLKFNKSINPLVITPVEGDDFMYMILPIRLRSGE